MNITINKNVIEHILLNSQNFLDKKDSSQITSHVLLTGENNNLNVKATDYEIGISMDSTNVTINDEGKATANGKKFLDIIKILKDHDVNLKTENDYLYITQKQSKFKLPMFNANEFPEFPTLENKAKFDISSPALLKSIKKIAPAIDTNNPKYELNGALIDIKENVIQFVSTDTRRLAITQVENRSDQTAAIIIPKKAITEIQKLFFDEIEIFYDNNMLIAKSPSFLFFTKLINGKYPDYERIIPKTKQYELSLNREKMIDHLKQVSTISHEMKITFTKEAIIFESLNEENIEAKTQLPYELNLEEDIYIAVNSKYILDFLSHIDKSTFTLGYNDTTLPFTLESENLTTIVMPIII